MASARRSTHLPSPFPAFFLFLSLAFQLFPIPAFCISSSPALYVFGASMVDAGENSIAMPRASMADYPPYGVDYFGSPTGRWSNGRTLLDFISQELGLGLLPPYLSSFRCNSSGGVNFASSGSTAVNNTAKASNNSGGLFPLLVQVEQFRDYRASLSQSSGNSDVDRHFYDSIYFVQIGDNDYLKVAFKTVDFDPLATVIATIAAMKQAFEALFDCGARTFIVMNVIPFGCTPSKLSDPYCTENRDDYGCKTDYLDLAKLHNEHLSILLLEMRSKFPLGEWILFDAYSILLDGFQNPSKYGVKYPFQVCCGAGGPYNYNMNVICGQSVEFENGTYLEAKRCEDPSLHIIWDTIHPVESFAQYLADGILNGTHLFPQFNIIKRMKTPRSLTSH